MGRQVTCWGWGISRDCRNYFPFHYFYARKNPTPPSGLTQAEVGGGAVQGGRRWGQALGQHAHGARGGRHRAQGPVELAALALGPRRRVGGLQGSRRREGAAASAPGQHGAVPPLQ